MEVTEMSISDIRKVLKRMMYSLSIVALHESGENRKDIIKIRDEIKKLLKNKNIEKKEVINELGFVVIGISILVESIGDKYTKKALKEVIKELY
ncbi:hypothetical protein [Acidianus manzaensis]|uniref:Uncharacterized protein n=1 Tax=Acidianus manzaensis TaxID=282676 RepID=A0A1W6K2G3_9CREN|nr:hypothetical protein [Acidianus manzaensis]ARM76741.1 hypothetical protein B6F84_12440 [Acidianus manzaensis]